MAGSNETPAQIAPDLLSSFAISAWIIAAVAVGVILLSLYVLKDFLARNASAVSSTGDVNFDYMRTLNEFWTSYGQLVLAIFVIMVVACLLLLGVIKAEAGLPILSGVSGFAIANRPGARERPTNGSKTNPDGNPKDEESSSSSSVS